MPQAFSVFSEALEALRRARLTQTSINLKISGNNDQRLAISYLFAAAHTFASPQDLLLNPKQSSAFGDSGQKRVSIETRQGTLTATTDSANNITEVHIPIPEGMATSAQLIIGRNIKVLRNMISPNLKDATNTAHIANDPATYHVLLAKDVPTAHMMTEILAHIAIGYGHNKGVHSVLEGIQTSQGKFPAVLVSSEIRDAILQAEKDTDLPPH